MRRDSFKKPPLSILLTRLLIPSFGFFLLGLASVSLLKRHPWSELQAARRAWEQIPAVCKTDFPLTEFQKTQCDFHWQAALIHFSWVSLPWVLMVLGGWVFFRAQNRWYHRVSSMSATTRTLEVQVCRDRPAQDWFGWFHGVGSAYVQPVAFTSQGARKLHVYVSPQIQDLREGDSLQVYEVRTFLGRSGWVAIPSHRSPSLQ